MTMSKWDDAAGAELAINVLGVVRSIPAGFVTTHDAIAAQFDVAPRQIARLLAKLQTDDPAAAPFHRVVELDGMVPGTAKLDPSGAHDGTSLHAMHGQVARLAQEGVGVGADGRIINFLDHLVAILAFSRERLPAAAGRRTSRAKLH
ncbi:MAG: MGMT family protein [Pseudomonadota bacterium]